MSLGFAESRGFFTDESSQVKFITTLWSKDQIVMD